IEYLPDYEALLGWAQRAGLISPAEERSLGARATRHPEQARRALAAAREVRECIRQVGAALSGQEQPSVSALNAAHRARVAAPGDCGNRERVRRFHARRRRRARSARGTR